MSFKIFVLEDDMNRIMSFKSRFQEWGHFDVSYAKNITEAKEKWRREVGHGWDFVFLDHDLGGRQMVRTNEENTGSGFVRWLLNDPYYPIPKCATWIIHSFNPVGAANMYNMLVNAGVYAKQIPSVWEKSVFEKKFNNSLCRDHRRM